MTDQELNEIMRQLEAQGWQPMVCDTPVTTYDMTVRCGKPTGIGNVPEHEHLPVSDELQRLAVQSFAKPVAQWDPLNAPVKGKRFKNYLMIAQRTLALLPQ